MSDSATLQVFADVVVRGGCVTLAVDLAGLDTEFLVGEPDSLFSDPVPSDEIEDAVKQLRDSKVVLTATLRMET